MARTYNSGPKGHKFGIGGTDYGKLTTSGLAVYTAPTALTDQTTVTITAAQVLGGIISHDPTGGACTATLPTAALLIAALAAIMEPAIGDTLDLTYSNAADAAESITVVAGSGGTSIPATGGVITQNESRTFRIRLTGVATGSEAYVVY